MRFFPGPPAAAEHCQLFDRHSLVQVQGIAANDSHDRQGGGRQCPLQGKSSETLLIGDGCLASSWLHTLIQAFIAIQSDSPDPTPQCYQAAARANAASNPSQECGCLSMSDAGMNAHFLAGHRARHSPPVPVHRPQAWPFPARARLFLWYVAFLILNTFLPPISMAKYYWAFCRQRSAPALLGQAGCKTYVNLF